MRQASVQIGGAVYDMDDFYFEFEVPFEDTTTVQTATVKIYNLAKATRAAIERNQPMIINAGYEGDVGAIFVGKISACWGNGNCIRRGEGRGHLRKRICQYKGAQAHRVSARI